jgi:hypothetical protein
VLSCAVSISASPASVIPVDNTAGSVLVAFNDLNVFILYVNSLGFVAEAVFSCGVIASVSLCRRVALRSNRL